MRTGAAGGRVPPGRFAAMSGQRRKVATTMAFDHPAQVVGCDHLDRITPGVDMPAHLQHARGLEADDQPAVLGILQGLCRVELKATGVLGADMFRSGRITIDYGSNRLWFEERGTAG